VIKNCNLLILRPPKDVQATGEAFSSQKRTSSTYLLTFVLFLWVIFALLDPDPDCESGSRSRDLIESRSNPDFQYWLKHNSHDRKLLQTNTAGARADGQCQEIFAIKGQM
jgi:hypothetical protein